LNDGALVAVGTADGFPFVLQAGALEREVQAVDSEFSGVLQSDHSRLAQLMCHTVSSM
jgi:secreted Zn-dependent insulinase-like peptidase